MFEFSSDAYVAIGCNGRGVAMSTIMGKLLSKRLTDENTKECPVPITRLEPFIFHDFRNIGIAASVAWNLFLDDINV